MNKIALYGALLVALGVAAGAWLAGPTERHAGESALTPAQRPVADGTEGAGGQQTARLERRLERLTSTLAAEVEQRHRLEQRLDALSTELAALHSNRHAAAQSAASTPEPVAATPPAHAALGDATDPRGAPEATMSMERALLAAGIDATTATEIRRRRDELSLSEIYLRDQATREGWVDTPEFTAKLAEIERQRTSIRDEIGDDAYDRYLAALDHPNRVAVNEVMLDSPAAVAGIQAGDVVLRYADTRIFDPGELVSATRGGTAGEPVRMEIMRQGQLLTIDVPRGPLGVSIAASKGAPGEG